MKELEQEREVDQNCAAPIIYVVEDEPALLELANLTLSCGPWRVKQFEDPAEAVQSFKKEKPMPALLLTDFSMGSMNGLELAAACKELNPQLKVVMMSGTARVDITYNTPALLDAFLPKPFYPRELLGLLKSVLGV